MCIETPDLHELVVLADIDLRVVAKVSGRSFAHVCGWHDGYHGRYEACDALGDTQAERDDYAAGRAAGWQAWYAINDTREAA